MNDQQWNEVKHIFESRGVSREVAEARPYEPYKRGDGWVFADGGPFDLIPRAQRAVTIIRDVRGADGLVMHKHPVPLPHQELPSFPLWDLPGGHVDAFETEPEALARELGEELGVQVPPPAGPPMACLDASGVELFVWAIHDWDGDVANLDRGEHDAIGWFDADDLVDLDLAHPAYRAMLLTVLR